MLENILFCVLFLMMPFFWLLLLKTARIKVTHFSIPLVIILSLFVLQYLGTPILFYQLDTYRVTTGVNDKFIVANVFLYTIVTTTLMIFGFIYGQKCFGNLCHTISYDVRPNYKLENICLIILFLICFLVLIMYLKKVGLENIALLKVLTSGKGIGADVARSSMGNAFSGKYHRYSLFMNELMIFTACAFFSQMLIKPTKWNKVFFLFIFFVTTFSMIKAIEKKPMADFLVALFFAYIIIRREGEIPLKIFTIFGFLLFSLLVCFYMIFMGSNSLAKATLNLVSRIFTGELAPAYYYLKFFPAYHEFLYGRSFPNPAGLMPFENFRLTVEIMNWYNPKGAAQGVVGSMPAIYWAEMYANFGLYGVLIAPFFVGFLIYWLNSFLLKFEPTPVSIALIVWTAIHMQRIASTSLSNFVFDTYFFTTFFAFLIIMFVGGHGKIRFKNN